MPRIPEMTQQFQYKSVQVPGPRLQGMSVQTNAGMFGAESGRDLERAGHMVQRGASQIAQVYDDYNTTKAREAAGTMQENFLSWQSEAQKRVGEAGINTAADYKTWYETQGKELTEGMNDIQKGRFQALAGRQMAAQQHWAEGYGFAQETQYKKTTAQARISAAADMLASNIQTPDLAAQAIEQTVAESRSLARVMGLGAEAADEMTRKQLSGMLTPAIHARIQSGETGLADSLIKQYSPQLGGQAVAQLEAANKQKRKSLEAEARAEHERFQVRQAATMGADLLRDFGTDTAAAQAKIAETTSDPLQQSRIAQSYMAQLGLQDRMADRQREEVRMQKLEQAEHILSQQGVTPAQASQAILEADPADQPRLTAMAQKQFDGANFITDRGRFAEAVDAVVDGSVNEKNWAEFEKQFSPYVSDKDMQTLEARVKKQEMERYEKGFRNRFTDSAVRVWGMKTSEANEAYNQFALYMFDFGIVSLKEREKAMDEWFKEKTINKDRLWGAYTSSKQVPAYKVSDAEKEGWYDPQKAPSGIPGVTREGAEWAKEKLRAGSKKITDESVRKFYEMNKGLMRVNP